MLNLQFLQLIFEQVHGKKDGKIEFTKATTTNFDAID